eukprot:SAG11_NODE_6519_length_1297_cov_0.945743_2_plen_96_part_00
MEWAWAAHLIKRVLANPLVVHVRTAPIDARDSLLLAVQEAQQLLCFAGVDPQTEIILESKCELMVLELPVVRDVESAEYVQNPAKPLQLLLLLGR